MKITVLVGFSSSCWNAILNTLSEDNIGGEHVA